MQFADIWKQVGEHSLLGEPRSRVLYNLLKLAPAGCMAEVGVYQGHTAKLMKLTTGVSRFLYAYDTYKGIVNADAAIDKHVDGEFGCDRDSVFRLLWATHIGGWDLVEGTFPDTYKQDSYAFVHSDTDTYFGAKSTLDTFWPDMVSGGIILFDDYRYDPCPGIEKALTEWLVTTGIEVMVSPTGGQAFVIKP